MLRVATAAVMLLGACSVYDERLLVGTGGQGAGAHGAGGDATGGAGAVAGSSGGAAGTTTAGGAAGTGGSGGSATDLGWPLDDSLPERCEPNPPDPGGQAWNGWGNLQFPPLVETTVGTASASVFGRCYRQSDTPAAGQAPGWQAELAVGPLGSLPTGEGRCWSYENASFNVDVGNDDEYLGSVTPTAPGLFGLFYRFRPPAGQWRYGDRDGSDNGLGAEQAATLVVEAATQTPAPLVAATLNLHCLLDDWPSRRTLVVMALARIAPDLVALQEDCREGAGPSQASEIVAELGSYTRRGYALVRESTHLAQNKYDEGIAVLSAHAIEASHVIALPYAVFPRKAIAVDVIVRGTALRFYGTHFDFGDENAAVRQQAAEAIVADLPAATASIVAGDLNATPDEPALTVLTGALTDLWPLANPSQTGATYPAAAPSERIDYVLGRSALAAAIVGARLLDEHQGGTLASDHFGVAAAVTVP